MISKGGVREEGEKLMARMGAIEGKAIVIKESLLFFAGKGRDIEFSGRELGELENTVQVGTILKGSCSNIIEAVGSKEAIRCQFQNFFFAS
jgi:hypothetical protein